MQILLATGGSGSAMSAEWPALLVVGIAGLIVLVILATRRGRRPESRRGGGRP